MRGEEILERSSVDLQTLHAVALTVQVLQAPNGSNVQVQHLDNKTATLNLHVTESYRLYLKAWGDKRCWNLTD